METRTIDIEIEEGRLHVRLVGSGEPALCLHGVSAHGEVWLPFAERVAAALDGRCSLWLPDLLGRGRSTPRPGLSYRLDDEVRRVRAAAAALGRELDAPPPRILIGHSHGAAIALAIAAEDPRVVGLVLSNPVGPWTGRPKVLALLGSPWARRLAARLFAPLRLPIARAVLSRAYGVGAPPPEAAARRYAEPYGDPRRAEVLMRVLADWRPAELASRLPARPLRARVLAGELDPRIEPASAARLAERLDAPLRLLAGVGHVIPEQAPDRLVEAVREVLEAV